MEKGVFGFKVRGRWIDVVEHGERISRAVRESRSHDVDGRYDLYFPSAFEEWEAWRPKVTEDLESDICEKTAEQASTSEGNGERAGQKPNEDIKTAGEKLVTSYELLEENDTEEAVDTWGASVNYVVRAADSTGRKTLRRIECAVYRNVMTQLAPYYFDNELISANVQRTVRRTTGDRRFIFEANINDDGLKSDVSSRLSKFDETVERWHVDVEKNTDALEAVEGVDVPPDRDTDADPMTN